MHQDVLVNVDPLPALEFQRSLSLSTEDLLRRSAVALSERYPNIWKPNPANQVLTISLAELDRIGGEYGFGGSKVFVAAMIGRDSVGNTTRSVPLLAKVVEDNVVHARKLLLEKDRYNGIGDLLVNRYHAKPLNAFPNDNYDTASRVLWSEFLDEAIPSGLPQHAPIELRHYLENGQWNEAIGCLGATYKILKPAHEKATLQKVCLFDHYAPYLRLDKGWHVNLRTAIGSTKTINVMGSSTHNPIVVFDALEKDRLRSCGDVFLSPVHGDLHPRNVIVGDIQRAALIDFGWTNDSFHTIVDFVLMEMSIKFFYLPWFLNRKDLAVAEHALADHFLPDCPPQLASLAGTILAIRKIREHARDHIDMSQHNWFVLQYLLPLFLTTMGAFAYAPKVTNLGYLLLSTGILAEKIFADLN